VRPTTDKVRNAIFSSVFDDVIDARVLDLFCGTGSFGLEALSRGASYCAFVDTATDLVNKNVTMADKSSYKVIKGRAETVIERLGDKFDIIFVDPPYETIDSSTFLKSIYDNEILAKDGVIIYEESVRAPFVFPEDIFELYNEKRYGDTKIYYLSVK